VSGALFWSQCLSAERGDAIAALIRHDGIIIAVLRTFG